MISIKKYKKLRNNVLRKLEDFTLVCYFLNVLTLQWPNYLNFEQRTRFTHPLEDLFNNHIIYTPFPAIFICKTVNRSKSNLVTQIKFEHLRIKTIKLSNENLG